MVSVCAYARQISENEAAAIATEFLNSTTVRQTPTKTAVHRAKAPNATEAGTAPFYVFNADNSKGFVIVSGDDRAQRILGYSDKGTFDFTNLPPQLNNLLSKFAKCLETMPADSPAHKSWRETARSEAPAGRVLLATAEWNQWAPYNAFYPEIDGLKTPTGCINTAQAILMKYHEWPLQGKGSVQYSWNGKSLSANLSESVYNWAKMNNQYPDNGEGMDEEEVKPVATLLRDISYANQTDFNLSGSGANYNLRALVENFSYAPKYLRFSRMAMTIDKLFAAIKQELDNGRPCLVISATTPAGLLAHGYVCDGYDVNGYLHYNFGWSGSSNGYYSMEPVNNFPSYDIEYYGGIEPDKGNIEEKDCLTISAYSKNNFKYDGQNIVCDLNVDFGFFDRRITVGIAFEKSDKSKTVTEIQSWSWTQSNCVWFIDVDRLNQTTSLDDGNYTIYPVVKTDVSDWRKFDFNEYYQDAIELTVDNGVWLLKNIPNPGPIDPGKVEIDNVYYILDQETHKATVTCRNSAGNNYSGDVTIPQSIEYNGEIYTVARIGYEAMAGCTIDRLELPKTIEVIEGGGLYCEIDWINLSEISSLKVIEGWGIVSNMPDISLPDNLEEIGYSAINFSNVKFLNIPASVRSIGRLAFIGCGKLENIQLNCSDREIIEESLGGYEMLNNIPLRNMYVPVGTKEYYESHLHFSNFPINIKEGEYRDIPGIDRSVDIDGVNYIFNPDTKKAKVTYSSYSDEYSFTPNISVPSTLMFGGEEYTVTEVDANSLMHTIADTLNLPATIEKIGIRGLELLRANEVNFEDLTNLTVIDNQGCQTVFKIENVLRLPSKLQTVGGESFANNLIEKLFLPKSLKHIGYQAFAYNLPLEAVFTSWATEEEIKDVCPADAFDGCDNLKSVIVPPGCVDLYKASEPWSKYEIFDKYLSLNIDKSNIEMKVGEQIKLTVTCSDSSFDSRKLIWETSNDCVEIDLDGNITAKYEGYCDITVRLEDESICPATCHIKVEFIEIQDLFLEPTQWKGCVGDEFDISAIIKPEDGRNKTLDWFSSDPTVAVVNEVGHVKALSEGNCLIIASTLDGSKLSASCEITVIKPDILVSSIVLNPSAAEGKEGEQMQIDATVLPEDATYKVIRWSSSDESIAKVNKSGLISLIKKGTAVITASATDGSGVSAECAVVVTEYAGIKDILTDKDTYVKIFNLQGIKVYEGVYSEANLAPDYYIVVCDGKNVKVKVE